MSILVNIALSLLLSEMQPKLVPNMFGYVPGTLGQAEPDPRRWVEFTRLGLRYLLRIVTIGTDENNLIEEPSPNYYNPDPFVGNDDYVGELVFRAGQYLWFNAFFLWFQTRPPVQTGFELIACLNRYLDAAPAAGLMLVAYGIVGLAYRRAWYRNQQHELEEVD